ncbi:MAG: hypothetical protein OEY43_10830 [Gammaproteobacteria bacterium]|nr:hypothetical protein [Gammaproteobacteria bacterium]
MTGWPSIIAVIVSYVKRGDAAGTYLESHFSWLIRTFWFALLWLLLSIAIALTFFGLPLAFFMLIVTGGWVLYRIARGVLRLMAEQAMPMPAR